MNVSRLEKSSANQLFPERKQLRRIKVYLRSDSIDYKIIRQKKYLISSLNKAFISLKKKKLFAIQMPHSLFFFLNPKTLEYLKTQSEAAKIYELLPPKKKKKKIRPKIPHKIM